MPEDWTSVYVRRSTHSRMKEEIQLLLRLHTEGVIQLPNDGDGLSMDALIVRMLDRVNKHRARGRAQKGRRRGHQKGGHARPGPAAAGQL